MAAINQQRWDEVTAAVRRLEGMNLHQLRGKWQERFGPPPKLRSVDLLARLLSWRMQADVAGGLDLATIKKLQHRTVPVAGPRLTPGVRIEREWRGVRQTVEVVEGGFRWQGQTYKSLSKVACVITGAKWNGPRFFGLRDEAA